MTIILPSHMSALSSGTHLGPYQVVELVGRGGMGEVYRAHDTRLGRTVAIKTLSADIGHEGDFRQRFEREARALASLSHPYICPVYDVGTHGDIDYIVMEFVEGETLADRLTRGPLPLREALARAIEIADALDKAHRRGIVHRDLKPGNVMLATNGSARPGAPQAKLLDFGLVKLSARTSLYVPSSTAASATTTAARPGAETTGAISAPLTGRGVVLGTVQYMAPEQLDGKPIDGRTDIFAFGALLYEMVTGRRAFVGESTASVVAAILERNPLPLTEVQPLTPASLERLVRRCLAKDPDERWQHAGDLLSELRWIAESSAAGAATSTEIERLSRDSGSSRAGAPPAARRVGLGAAAAAAIVAATLSASAVWLARPEPPTSAPRRFAPRTTIVSEAGIAVSNYDQPGAVVRVTPDGRHVVFVGFRGAQTLLFRYELETGKTVAIEGTEGARGFMMSPDGSSLAFGGTFATNFQSFRRVSLLGGQVTVLPTRWEERGGAWVDETNVVLSGVIRGPGDSPVPTGESPLRLAKIGSGDLEPLPTSGFEPNEAHLFPQPLNEGFIVTARHGSAQAPTWSVNWVDRKGFNQVVVDGAFFGKALPRHIVYSNGLRRLVAQRFDAAEHTVSGEPVTLVDDARTTTTGGVAQFDVTAAHGGTLVYVSGSANRDNRRPVWVGRDGGETALSTERRSYANSAVSPDGKKAWLSSLGLGSLWLLDLSTGATTAPIQSASNELINAASWLTDDRVIATRIGKADRGELLEIDLSTRKQDRLFTAPAPGALRWAQVKGQRLVFAYSTPETSFDIWTMTLGKPETAKPWMATPAREDTPTLSPDGKLIAYVSNETGKWEVYVAPVEAPGRTKRVSTDGALEPLFSRSGKELFFRRGEEFWATSIRLEGSEVLVGQRRLLFQGNYVRRQDPPGRSYDVAPDDSRFLMLKDDLDASDRINVIFNFFDLLNERLP